MVKGILVADFVESVAVFRFTLGLHGRSIIGGRVGGPTHVRGNVASGHGGQMLRDPKQTYVDAVNDRKECPNLWMLSGNKSFLRKVEGWQLGE